MTREEVKKLLMTVEAIYPHFKIDDAKVTLDAWEMVLEDQDAGLIYAALKHYARTNTSGYAPGAGQLIQTAYDLRNKGTELSPSEAWSMVYKAICRAGYYAEEDFDKFPEEVKRAVGSPSQLRAWGLDSDFNEGVASSNFRKAYSTVCDRRKSDALMAPETRQYIESLDIKCIECGG